MAIAYDGAKQYTKEQTIGEELYQRRSQKLGPDHPDTISSMQNLAYVYFRQGKNREQKRYQEAESLYREALGGEIKALGNNHPEIAYAW